MSAHFLSVRELCAYYGQTQVLFGLDFDMMQGGITTLLGANGAGKTSTLRSLSGMLRTAGEVRFEDRVISGKATEDIGARITFFAASEMPRSDFSRALNSSSCFLFGSSPFQMR